MNRFITLALALLLLSLPVDAHNLRLFASQEGDHIEGEAYFAGAGAAAGATITLEQQGEVLVNLTCDDQGQFSLQLPGPGAYELVADAGQGHQARWVLDANAIVKTSSEPQATQQPQIETASLAQQLRALKRDIEQLRSERRLQDLIGGLGYILGLTGLAAWLLSRKRQQHAH